MPQGLQTLFALTLFLASLVGILLLALLRWRRRARDRRVAREMSEGAFMAAAMQEAVARLRDKEQAQQARAEHSERVSDELEERLRLRESLAQVGEMTAGIAHEFRNSLATIHGYARLIDLRALSARDRTCVEGIQQETQALGEVVTNFLHFARPVDVALEVVDLRAVWTRVLEEISPELMARGGMLDVTGPGVLVEGDEVLLRQAFDNLCRNALEACAARDIRPAIAIELRVDRDRRQAFVSVTDNGPGVEPTARERMFQPFFTTKARGTGLGLALVQKIVVIHNGRIVPVHPEHGGLRMEISLPLAENAMHLASPA